jgi:hypothetical protein
MTVLCVPIKKHALLFHPASPSFIMDELVTTEVQDSASKTIDDQQDNIKSPVQNCNQLLVSEPSQLSNTIDSNMFKNQSSSKFFEYHHIGLGLAYLASMSMFHCETESSFIQQHDYETVMYIAHLTNSLSNSQRYHFANILRRVIEQTKISMGPRVGPICDISTSVSDIRRYIVKGKFSIFSNLPTFVSLSRFALGTYFLLALCTVNLSGSTAVSMLFSIDFICQ